MPDPVAAVSIAAVALANLGMLCVAYRRLSRTGLTGAFLGLVVLSAWGTEYVLRPITVMLDGEFGRENGYHRVLNVLDPAPVIDANIISLVSTFVFTTTLIAFHCSRQRMVTDATQRSEAHGRRRRLRLPLIPLFGVSLLASGFAALQIGSLGGALNGQFGRQNVSSGYFFVFVNVGGLSVLVALATLPVERLRQRWTKRILALGYLGFVALHLLVLGGRAEVIIVTIAAVMILTTRTGRPQLRTLVVGLLLATAGLGVHRVTTREAFSSEVTDKSQVELALDAIRNPLALVTRYDVTAYDKLILMEQADPALGLGSTYLPALTAPIPGAPTAGSEGGNRVFTRLFIPDRYERSVTFEGISMLGEARYNFGWIGPPMVAAFAGWALGSITRRAGRGPMWLLAGALSAGILPGVIRADAFNTVALGGSLVIFTLGLTAIATRTRLTHAGPYQAVRGTRPPVRV
jgi:hypothetical protein